MHERPEVFQRGALAVRGCGGVAVEVKTAAVEQPRLLQPYRVRGRKRGRGEREEEEEEKGKGGGGGEEEEKGKGKSQ